jgi:hypothetical protein
MSSGQRGGWMRRTMQIIKGLAIGVLCAVGVVAVINLHDEALLPELEGVLSGSNYQAIAAEKNAFFGIIGFASAEGDQISAEGQRIFKLYQERLNRGDVDSDSLSNFYRVAGAKELSFDGSAAELCPIVEQAPPYRCIQQADAKRELWESMLKKNWVFLDRYQQLYSEDQFSTRLKLTSQLVFLSWAHVSNAKKLLESAWALRIRRGEIDSVISQVREDLQYWRAILAQPDLMLIDKMVVLAQVRSDFLFVSELLRTTPLQAAQYAQLAELLTPITRQERSLMGPMMGEVQFSVSVASEFLKNERDSREPISFVLRPLSPFLFKRNATVNRFYQRNRELGSISEQECISVRQSLAGFKEASNFGLHDLLYNPVGNYLFGMGSGDGYGPYIQRMCDLQGIQRLVALQLMIRRDNVAATDIPAYIQKAGTDYADPYSGKPMQWNPEAKGLTFDASDSRNRALMSWPIE